MTREDIVIQGSKIIVNYSIEHAMPLVISGPKVSYKVEPEFGFVRFYSGARTVLVPIGNILSIDMTLT